jgi:excisionase family DNA binding protein
VTTQSNVSALPETTEWIGRREIETIAGALKPSAYVARAYKYTNQNGGAFPDWARKLNDDKWLFRAEYIREDAKKNTETMSVHEAAEVLGATRRAVQLWVDQGEIPALGGNNRDQGGERRIIRETFMRELPRLRKRLETPSVVIRKIKSRHDIPADVVERVRVEMKARHAAARERDRLRRHESGKTDETLPLPFTEETVPEAANLPQTAPKIAPEMPIDAVKTDQSKEIMSQEPEAVGRHCVSAPRAECAWHEARRDAVPACNTPIETDGLLKITDKQRIALALEQRLNAATAARRKTETGFSLKPLAGAALAKTEESPGRAFKEKSVAALEARLKAAVAEKAAESAGDRTKLEERAMSLAEAIQARMYDEDFGVRKAMIMFMQEAAIQGIPKDIRIKIGGKVFGQ